MEWDFCRVSIQVFTAIGIVKIASKPKKEKKRKKKNKDACFPKALFSTQIEYKLLF